MPAPIVIGGKAHPKRKAAHFQDIGKPAASYETCI